MAERVSVEISGLRELRRSLRGMGEDAKPTKTELKEAGKRAAELVAQDARSRAPVRSGRLRDSIKAYGSTTGGRVKGGKKTVPYYGFQDFGGTIRQTTKSGGVRLIRKPFIKEGRILYPALSANRERTIDLYRDAVEAIIHKNGLKPD